MMNNRIHILDTTLRDGDQWTGTPFMQKEKILVARKLMETWVDIIEAGFARSRIDTESIKEVINAIGTEADSPIIASLSRWNKYDIDASFEALQRAKYPRIHTFIATSQEHMKYKLHMTPDQVITNIRDSVSHASLSGMQVQWSAEDATNSEREFLLNTVITAIESWATIINIPDTLGWSNPWFVEELFWYITEKTNFLRKQYDFIISAHMHNDNGLALANTIAAIRWGARQVETTVLWIWERTGNVALHQIIAYLNETNKILWSEDRLLSNINTCYIYPTSLLVSKILWIEIKPNEPIIWGRTNSHGSWIHSDWAIKWKKSEWKDIYSVIDTSQYWTLWETKTFNARGWSAEILDMLWIYIDIAHIKSEYIEALVTKCAKMAELSRWIYPSLVYAYYLEISWEFKLEKITIIGTHRVEITIQIHNIQYVLSGESDEENWIIAATMNAINNFLDKKNSRINLIHFQAEDRVWITDLENEFFPKNRISSKVEGEKAIWIVTFDLENSEKETTRTRFSSQNVDEASIRALIYGSINELI